jgi:hypothetical protein
VASAEDRERESGLSGGRLAAAIAPSSAMRLSTIRARSSKVVVEKPAVPS